MNTPSIKASDIPTGQGITSNLQGKAVAVYNTGDSFIVLENACTHRGCQTDWNAGEKTWDCPCHGSRYHADGSILRGPATVPLPRLPYYLENNEIFLK